MAGRNESETLDLFVRIGLDERTAKNTIANNKVTANLTAVIREAGVTDGCDRTVGNLLYTVATKFPANALVHRPTLLEYITLLKIKTPAQLDAAFAFLTATASDNLNVGDFEVACGVGVEVSLKDIEPVDEICEESKALIVEQRYRTNVGELFGYVRKKQPWADPKIVKTNRVSKNNLIGYCEVDLYDFLTQDLLGLEENDLAEFKALVAERFEFKQFPC